MLLVTKLDRLARSTRDLLNTLACIGDKGASFKSLGDPWADTTTGYRPNFGDGRDQAATANFCDLTISIPSVNFTPRMTFGNWL